MARLAQACGEMPGQDLRTLGPCCIASLGFHVWVPRQPGAMGENLCRVTSHSQQSP